MKIKAIIAIATLFAVVACHEWQGHKTVLCIPVYGQSLALGEEAVRQTDFDSLAAYADGRIVTEKLDHSFGYFDNNGFKLWVKRLVHYRKRAFELSVYTMAQRLADQTGCDTLICIFPGGQGATALKDLSKGSTPYEKFISNIASAYNEAVSRGWDFQVPAVCWMQGESDIVDYPDTDYRELLLQIRADMEADIRRVTHSQAAIPFICYQPNALTRAQEFKADRYDSREMYVPQTFVDLLRNDSLFWASGPIYPYRCVREAVHIDAEGQQAIGTLAAQSALGIIRGADRCRGLIPLTATAQDSEVTVSFNVPTLPLTIDTVQVRKATNYGFSVITPSNRDIATAVSIDSQRVCITCSEPAQGCKVRYAAGGDYMKSGNQHGPRGNLRDASGHWCYQFDISTEEQ